MQSWWTEQSGPWFALFAVSGPIVVPLVLSAARGRHRRAVLSTWIGIVLTYSVVTLAGVLAMVSRQPTYVWIPLVLAGFFTAVPYAATYRLIRNKYVEIELRRSQARDL
jgi:hypothetical protein